MKWLFGILIAIILLAHLVACGGGDPGSSEQRPTEKDRYER